MIEKNSSAGLQYRRSIGLTILACLFILLCAWGILRLFTGLKNSFLFMKQYQELNLFACLSTHTFWGDLSKWGLGFIYFLFGIIAIGIFRLREWSKRDAIFLSSLIIIFYICVLTGRINISQGIEWDLVPEKDFVKDNLETVLIITFFSFIIYYLTRPKVKRQFMSKS